MGFDDLFDQDKNNKNKCNFKYLIDCDKHKELYQEIYNLIINCLSIYKTDYKLFATELRNVWEAVMSAANTVLGIRYEIVASGNPKKPNAKKEFDGIKIKSRAMGIGLLLSDLSKANDNKISVDHDGSDTQAIRDNFLINFLGLTKYGHFLSNSKYVHDNFINYESYNIGEDFCSKGYPKARNMQIVFNTSPLASIRDSSFNYVVFSDFILSNIGQSFLSFIVHGETWQCDFGEKNDEKNLIYYYKAFDHSLLFLNHFLKSLLTAENPRLDLKEYKLNSDYYPIGDRKILGSYRNIIDNRKNDYTLLFAESITNDNERLYYIIKQVNNYKWDSLESFTGFDNLIEIEGAIRNIYGSNICSGNVVVGKNKDDTRLKRFYLFEYFLPSRYKYHTLSASYLSSLSLEKKLQLINSLKERLDVLHSENICLRYMNNESFIVMDLERRPLQLYPVNLEFANKVRNLDANTTKDLKRPATAFFFIDGLDYAKEHGLDISAFNNAYKLDIIYMLYLAAYIKVDGMVGDDNGMHKDISTALSSDSIDILDEMLNDVLGENKLTPQEFSNEANKIMEIEYGTNVNLL